MIDLHFIIVMSAILATEVNPKWLYRYHCNPGVLPM